MRRLLALLPLLATAAAPAGDERSYMVSGFERLRVDGPFDVEVTRGTSSRARAEGDRQALERLEVRVEGSTLVVSAGTGGWRSKPGELIAAPRVRIVAPELRAVLVNGGGRVRVAQLEGMRVDVALNGAGVLDVGAIRADDLNVTLTGTGAMTLAGTARRARIRSNGAGSFDGGGLVAEDANVFAESAGDTRLGARFTARVNAFGAGTVRILGQPKCTILGNGPVECGRRE